jgi:hypothetical protein
MAEPLDYERREAEPKRREWWYPISGGLCVVGAGLIAIAGAVLMGLGSNNDAREAGVVVLFAALAALVVGIVRVLKA